MSSSHRYNVTICGFGLIGGSIALDLASSQPRPTVRAFDYARVLRSASRESRFKVLTEANLHQAIESADVLILAASPKANREILRLAAESPNLDHCLIIDVGSTKRSICALGKKLSFAKGTQFVGCHPMAGTEKAGYQHAEKGLFRDNPWFVDSDVKLTQENREKLQWLVRAVKAQKVLVPADDHDRIVATISHMPQLISTLLAAQMSPQILRLAGPGLKSMLRLAGSPYALWADIIEENREEIVDALTTYRDNLTTIISHVKKRQSLKPIFDSAGRSYRCLL